MWSVPYLYGRRPTRADSIQVDPLNEEIVLSDERKEEMIEPNERGFQQDQKLNADHHHHQQQKDAEKQAEEAEKERLEVLEELNQIYEL